MDREDLKTRTALGAVLAAQKANSQFAQNHPKVMEACNALIDAGTDLGASKVRLDAARALVAQEETNVALFTVTFDKVYSVLAAESERSAVTDADLQSLGLTVAVRQTYTLIEPTGIDGDYDVFDKELTIVVKLAPGTQGCLTEISTDPSDPTKWQRLKGMGARHVLGGLAAGTYWVRAAAMRANEESAYFGPVPVVVS